MRLLAKWTGWTAGLRGGIAEYIFHMDTLLDAVFSGDAPSLVLPSPGRRAGLMGPGEIRKALADLAGRLPAKPLPDRLRVLEGLALLWHDHWDAAHEIAQSREGEPDHDLLHAMLHRREGDFANAGYWFGGSGKHPCYPLLARRLSSLSMLSAHGLRAAGLQEDRWSARVFLAAVRARTEGERGGRAPSASAAAASPSDASLVLVQAEEFRAFAAYLIGS
jgi:hypothetical protein